MAFANEKMSQQTTPQPLAVSKRMAQFGVAVVATLLVVCFAVLIAA